MPPAKKTATRRTSRRPNANSALAPITRKEVEAAAARFDKALDEATQALQTMRADFGKNARSAYKDVADTLSKLRRDAKSSNRTLIKDIEQLARSMTPGLSPARKPAASARSTTKSAAKSAGAKAAGAKVTAAKSAGAKSGSGRGAAKSASAKPSNAAAKTSRSKSTTARSSSSKRSGTRRSG